MVTTSRFIVIASVLLFGAGAYESPAASKDAAALTSRTLVRSSDSAYGYVELPQDIDFKKGVKVSVRGRGRAYGFALVQDEPGARPGDGTEIYGFRMGFCNRAGCQGSNNDQLRVWGHNFKPKAGRSFVPAGTYRLYVIADDANVTVSLHLPGLVSGTRRLSLDHSARARVHSPPVWYEESAARTILSAGEERPFGGPGIAYLTLWHKGTASAGSIIGDCEYDDTPPRGEIAYAPGCPTADYGVERMSYPSSEDYIVHRSISYSYFPRAFGMYYGAPHGVTEAGVVSLWLSYK